MVKFSILTAIFALGVAQAATQGQSQVSASAKSPATLVMAGPGLSVVNGRTGMALNLGLLTPVVQKSDLMVGLDAAVNVWREDGSAASQSGNQIGIQMLPTAFYQFTLAASPSLHPFLGISAGPHYLTGANGRVVVELLFRNGMMWELTDNALFTLEPKFGILDGDFAFVPQMAAVFKL